MKGPLRCIFSSVITCINLLHLWRRSNYFSHCSIRPIKILITSMHNNISEFKAHTVCKTLRLGYTFIILIRNHCTNCIHNNLLNNCNLQKPDIYEKALSWEQFEMSLVWNQHPNVCLYIYIYISICDILTSTNKPWNYELFESNFAHAGNLQHLFDC